MEDEARDLNSLLSYLPTKDTNEQIPFHERPTGLEAQLRTGTATRHTTCFQLPFISGRTRSRRQNLGVNSASSMRCMLTMVSSAGPHLGCLCAATVHSPPCQFHEQATLSARTAGRCSRAWTPTWMRNCQQPAPSNWKRHE